MAALHETFEQQPIDSSNIPQAMLDLDSRDRTNLFPWRGQFSPCLIELLLSTYSSTADRVFDPFAGVGTTLFEAARQNLSSVGTEINPAAIAMATTVDFIPLDQSQRSERIQSAATLLEEHLGYGVPLFEKGGSQNLKSRIAELIKDAPSTTDRSLLTNALIRAMKSTSEVTIPALHSALRQHSEIVMNLPVSSQECSISQADARKTGIMEASVDIVVTSPPYINVFNYHQNNRPAMELLGRNVLEIAKSEFGSNRKHRGNRFLTVVQYCLDLHATLTELRRVIKCSGRAIFVVGRESTVRGVAFQNGSLVASLAEMTGFRLALRQERKFKNMYGELIYEDILHFIPQQEYDMVNRSRELAVQALEESLRIKREPAIVRDLEDAIQGAGSVKESPLFGTDSTSEAENYITSSARWSGRSLVTA